MTHSCLHCEIIAAIGRWAHARHGPHEILWPLTEVIAEVVVAFSDSSTDEVVVASVQKQLRAMIAAKRAKLRENEHKRAVDAAGRVH